MSYHFRQGSKVGHLIRFDGQANAPSIQIQYLKESKAKNLFQFSLIEEIYLKWPPPLFCPRSYWMPPKEPCFASMAPPKNASQIIEQFD